jgi:hypothetical protein
MLQGFQLRKFSYSVCAWSEILLPATASIAERAAAGNKSLNRGTASLLTEYDIVWG